MKIFPYFAKRGGQVGVLLTAAAALIACGQGTHSHGESAKAACPVASDTTINGLTIKEGWIRAAPEGAMSAGYLTISNNSGADDRLISAQLAKATMTEIHQSLTDEDGTSLMRRLPDGITVTTGSDVKLEQGSYHLMMMKLKAPLEDCSNAEVVLNFEKAGDVTLTLPVKGIKASMDHSGH